MLFCGPERRDPSRFYVATGRCINEPTTFSILSSMSSAIQRCGGAPPWASRDCRAQRACLEYSTRYCAASYSHRPLAESTDVFTYLWAINIRDIAGNHAGRVSAAHAELRGIKLKFSIRERPARVHAEICSHAINSYGLINQRLRL